MNSDQEVIDRTLARYNNPSAEQVESGVARVWKGIVAEVRETPDGASFRFVEDRRPWRSAWTVAIATAALLVLGILSIAIVRNVARLSGPTASVETVDGKLYRVSGEKSYSIAAGERISTGETVRAEGGAVLALADRSRVEMRSGAEFSLESAGDGARIRLKGGSIIVSAEKQISGHIYVQTKDVTVSVVGTVFLVNAEEEGSRVAVIQGEVRVLQAGIEKTLLPGDQVATVPALELRPVSEEIAWSRNAQEHIALLLRTGPTPPLPVFQRGTPRGGSQFDVASLKVESQPPNGSRAADLQGLSCTGSDGAWRAMMSAGVTPFSAPRGRCLGQYIGIQMLLAALYDVPLARVTGALPNWRVAGSPYEFGFRIETTAEDVSGVTTAQLRQMLKALLVERFKLKVHLDVREADGFGITVASGGLKIQSVSNSEESQPSFEEGDRQQIIKGKTSLKRFADFLSQVPPMRCTLVDRTGMDGLFDYTLTLRLVLVGDAQALDEAKPIDEAKRIESKKVAAAGGVAPLSRTEGCGSPFSRNGRTVYEYNPSVATAIQQQLGLRLEPQKVSVEHLVIDGVSEPTEN